MNSVRTLSVPCFQKFTQVSGEPIYINFHHIESIEPHHTGGSKLTAAGSAAVFWIVQETLEQILQKTDDARI